jgi:hypothetical protein
MIGIRKRIRNRKNAFRDNSQQSRSRMNCFQFKALWKNPSDPLETTHWAKREPYTGPFSSISATEKSSRLVPIPVNTHVNVVIGLRRERDLLDLLPQPFERFLSLPYVGGAAYELRKCLATSRPPLVVSHRFSF